MTPPAEDESMSTPSLNRVLTALSIVTFLIGGAFWVFSAQATAQRADANAAIALQKLDSKADKAETQEQLKRIYDKLDSIDSYLRDRQR